MLFHFSNAVTKAIFHTLIHFIQHISKWYFFECNSAFDNLTFLIHRCYRYLQPCCRFVLVFHYYTVLVFLQPMAKSGTSVVISSAFLLFCHLKVVEVHLYWGIFGEFGWHQQSFALLSNSLVIYEGALIWSGELLKNR